MYERDPSSSSAGPRALVDEAISRYPTRLNRCVQIRHAVADVMDPWAALREESADRAFSIQGGQELDLGLPEGEGQNGGPVDYLRWMRLNAKDVSVKGERGLEIGNSYSDMGDAGTISHRFLQGLRCYAGNAPLAPPEAGSWLWAGQAMRAHKTQQENNMDATNTPDATNTSTVHVSDASFALEIEQANGLVLVDFWASWCGPCHMVAPILDQLAGEYAGKAKVAKVDVDVNQRTAMRFNVRSIPSILFFKNGQHVDTVVGAVPKATLEGKIKQHLS
jgi:thioredoxin 1